jgi:hypothetical protein
MSLGSNLSLSVDLSGCPASKLSIRVRLSERTVYRMMNNNTPLQKSS